VTVNLLLQRCRVCLGIVLLRREDFVNELNDWSLLVFVCFWDWHLPQKLDFYLSEDFSFLIRIGAVIPRRDFAVQDTEHVMGMICFIGDGRSEGCSRSRSFLRRLPRLSYLWFAALGFWGARISEARASTARADAFATSLNLQCRVLAGNS